MSRRPAPDTAADSATEPTTEPATEPATDFVTAAPASKPPKNRLSPKKLLLSKWTAVSPQNREKHFLVTRVIEPDPPEAPVEWVELEAAHSRRSMRIAWRELLDGSRWRQGWV